MYKKSLHTFNLLLQYLVKCRRSKMTFKITHNIYDGAVSPDLSFYPSASTRGNNYKLVNHSFHYDLRKHFFSARIVNTRNNST